MSDWKLFWILLLVGQFNLRTVAAGLNPNLDTLRLAQVVFRHGDRTPTRTYPNDPYGNITVYWPEGLGQLTDIGKRQQFQLGRYLRSRYDGFIPSTFNNYEIEVMSSDMDRTIMSVEANLAGLFKPNNLSYNWSPDIPWTPVPFRTIPKYEDNMLQLEKPCPRLEQLQTQLYGSDYYKKLRADTLDLIEYIRVNAGFNASASLKDILTVADVFTVDMAHNLSLPDWATGEFLAKLKPTHAIFELTKSATPEMKKIYGGPLLKAMLTNMEKVINRHSQLKFAMYSAHDTTLMRIMDALGVFNDPIMPPYAAMFTMELHESVESGHWVELFYRNDTSQDPVQLIVPGCTVQCPILELLDLTVDVIPINWDKECRTSGHKGFQIVFLIILAGSAVSAVVFLVWCLTRQRRRLSINSSMQDLGHKYGAIE